jgi:hypothetical protein
MRYHTVSSLRQFDPTHPTLHTIGLPHSTLLTPLRQAQITYITPPLRPLPSCFHIVQPPTPTPQNLSVFLSERSNGQLRASDLCSTHPIPQEVQFATRKRKRDVVVVEEELNLYEHALYDINRDVLEESVVHTHVGDISYVCMDHGFLKDIAGCIKLECNKSDQKGTSIHPYKQTPPPPPTSRHTSYRTQQKPSTSVSTFARMLERRFRPRSSRLSNSTSTSTPLPSPPRVLRSIPEYSGRLFFSPQSRCLVTVWVFFLPIHLVYRIPVYPDGLNRNKSWDSG